MRIVDRSGIEKKIAVDRGLSIIEVRKAVHSQFQYIRKVMQEGNYEQIRLPYFGRFRVHPTKLALYLKRNGNHR
jgi:nucleoid DNA-binding protein